MHYITNKKGEFFTGENFDSDIKKAKFFPEEELMKLESIFLGCEIKEYEEDPREGWVHLSPDELVELCGKMDDLGYQVAIEVCSLDKIKRINEQLKIKLIGEFIFAFPGKSSLGYAINHKECSFSLRLFGDIEINTEREDGPLFMDFIHESKLPMSQYEILKMMTNS